jgi:hypothetical protein
MLFPTLAVASPHTRGKDVEEAQWLLGHNRWNQKFYTGQPDSEYGPVTGAAAHRAKYWLGYPTGQIDSHMGAKLRSFLVKIDHPSYKDLPVTYKVRRKARIAKAAADAKKVTLGEKRIIEAEKHIGYREGFGNRTIFGKWYGADGNPWCAYFASWCDNKAGGKFMFGYCPYIVSAAFANQNGLYVTNNPLKGDFVLYDWQSDGTFDHIGLFVKWIDRAKGTFETIEGNTLPEGGTGDQSNGGGVYRRQRHLSGNRVVFIREKS